LRIAAKSSANYCVSQQKGMSSYKIRTQWYNYKNNQNDVLFSLIYYSKSALHISGYVFDHHQEHLTVFRVSGSVHPSCCRLVSWMSWNCRTRYSKYSQVLLMMVENIVWNM
jgi:hypothetical protein